MGKQEREARERSLHNTMKEYNQVLNTGCESEIFYFELHYEYDIEEACHVYGYRRDSETDQFKILD